MSNSVVDVHQFRIVDIRFHCALSDEEALWTEWRFISANGVAILMVSLAARWFPYRTILKGQDEHGWHLLHAGGSGRGLMLIGLGGTITLLQLPVWLTRIAAWLIIIFAWSSVAAMIITALTGERGFGWFGPVANRLAYALYVMGTIVVFPAFAVFLIGFAAAL